MPAVGEASKDSSNKGSAWTTAEDDDSKVAAVRMLVVDKIWEVADELPLKLGDDVDESDCASVEGCRSLDELPATSNSFDAVSEGCTPAASLPVGVTSVSAADIVDPAAVGKVVGRVADISRPWLDALVVGSSVAGLLLDTTFGINGVAVSAVEGVMEEETSELAAMEGINDKEDVGMVVEVWLSAGAEGISVSLRNRAT